MEQAQNIPVCPRFHHAVELIGRRWTGAILRALLSGSARYSDIAESVPGVSAALLSERLKELEATGIVERHVIPSTPVRVEYRLTPKGEDLLPVVQAVGRWAHKWDMDEPCTCRSAATTKGAHTASTQRLRRTTAAKAN